MSSDDPRSAAGGQHARGRLIVVSAPSGAGKSSVLERVLARVANLRYSISYTTRKPRGAEVDGLNYHFVTSGEFSAMRDRGEFLEWAEVHGHYYATHRGVTEDMLAGGFDVILDIDVQGARLIRERAPDAVTVFILPPSQDELRTRLQGRKLNERSDLERRLSNGASEVRACHEFEYTIINDDLERASASLEAIIVAERHRTERQRRAAESIIATFGGQSPDGK
ncbi:MAG TPA: guanylate kinase [Blastocatellia bacterium]|nr:guanylate kinase [Blastocatellia bacterium]